MLRRPSVLLLFALVVAVAVSFVPAATGSIRWTVDRAITATGLSGILTDTGRTTTQRPTTGSVVSGIVANHTTSVGALTGSPVATAAATAALESECGWPVESTPTKANVAYPDSNATYWTMPFVYTPGLKITLAGTFPTARFFSVNVYSSDAQAFTFNGRPSALADYQLTPDAGSQNPWVTAGAPTGGAYTITIARTAARGAVNFIPIAPATPTTPLIAKLPKTTGFLMIRVYLPEGGDPSTVPLPPITFTYGNGDTRTIEPCAFAQTTPGKPRAGATFAVKALARLILGPPPAPTPLPADNPCSEALVFCKAGGTTTPFPNSVSGYAAATYQPAAGYVTVVQAQMPTSASAYGNAPGPWPTTGIDLRYWSVCNYIHVRPFPVVKVGPIMGCVADEDVPLVNGVATVVLSSVKDRPRATKGASAKVAWVPTSATNRTAVEVVAIRNMLAAPGFSQSVMNAQNSNQPSAESTMTPYYPKAVQCTTATFAKGGAAGCFASPASPS